MNYIGCASSHFSTSRASGRGRSRLAARGERHRKRYVTLLLRRFSDTRSFNARTALLKIGHRGGISRHRADGRTLVGHTLRRIAFQPIDKRGLGGAEK
jgi:hypothetical protein